jgi:hypothetical protein
LVETGRSSGSPGLLCLPIPAFRDSDIVSDTFLSGLTAAGTAPELHRIPFLIHPLGKEGMKPYFSYKTTILGKTGKQNLKII